MKILVYAWLLFIPGWTWSASYYLDCVEGLDTNLGNTPDQAWQSLATLGAAALNPGDRILIKRGCSWKGPLTMPWYGTFEQPIKVGTYGTGAPPLIFNGDQSNVILSGRYIEVESLWVESAPVSKDAACLNQPIGNRYGFTFPNGSTSNTLRHVHISGHSIGVYMATGSQHNRVLHSRILDNTSLYTNDKTNPSNDAGAFGILINGNYNEIAFDTLSNNLAWCSYDYGTLGASINIFNGKGNRIHHNSVESELAFVKLAGTRTADNIIAYNLVVSKLSESLFLKLYGRSGKFGPSLNTITFNNSVYLTGNSSQGVLCLEGCSSDILSLQNNLIWSDGTAISINGTAWEDHNIFWKTGGNPLLDNLKMHPSSKSVDPGFIDPVRKKFQLVATSPALNSGNSEVSAYAYDKDMDGNLIPSGQAIDLGCFESPSGMRVLNENQMHPRLRLTGWGDFYSLKSYNLLGRKHP